jgi:dihydroxyacetone kinase-like predicted kinase
MGNSLLVVGDATLVRVHVHTMDPDGALSYGRELGTISNEKVENMETQFETLASSATASQESVSLAVVAVAAGDGLDSLFRSLGARAVVHGGQTMNPSAGDIREAIEAAGGAVTIVLPNNKNIVLAADQAARVIGSSVHVVPTRSIPQGIAALIAMNIEASFDENIEAMSEAIAAVRSGEVTLAARSTTIGGVVVREGQPISLVDGDLIAATNSIPEAVHACVARMVEGRDGAILTLIAGEGETPENAEALARALREQYSCEVELVDGGQPHYPYLIGAE